MNGFAVAQDRDAVADGAQFLQAVRDINHAQAAIPQSAHDAEYFLRLRAGQRRCRLVEDDQARSLLNGSANLDQLLPRGTELSHAPLGIQGKLVARDEIGRAPHHLTAVHPPQRKPFFAAQKNVFGHGEMRRQQRFLVHHGDPVRGRFRRVAEAHRLAAPQHFAAVGGLQAGDNLHQRGFAGAVLPHQQMNLAAVDRKVSPAQRDHAAESFFDSLQIEKH